MTADFAIAAVQSGWACRSSAKKPAMCGLDIDVPAIDWNRSPFGVAPEIGGRSPNGEPPARIWRPGAVMSGLMTSPALGFGPRDEKIVIDGS